MTSVIFDSGPIISLATNNLLWILEALEQKSNVTFYITHQVKHELIDRPMETHRFKFEALQVNELLSKNVLRIATSDYIDTDATMFLDLANHTFKAQENWIPIVSLAEMSVLSAGLHLQSAAILIDELTTRALIEDISSLKERMASKMHMTIEMSQTNANLFTQKTRGVTVLRSAELATIALEKGLFERFRNGYTNKDVIDSILWGLKINGCAITMEEIERIVKMH